MINLNRKRDTKAGWQMRTEEQVEKLWEHTKVLKNTINRKKKTFWYGTTEKNSAT